ncbi:basic region leucine zipper [Ancylostoma duodenale]|uniref:Basic region leucine zipper n=1 Tax=Ancylostoma duodenale TaxID=51022 RepID=A0A0C2CWF7_9BILA|nr:basic region leucine zipper [Ancylostoma duodenale]
MDERSAPFAESYTSAIFPSPVCSPSFSFPRRIAYASVVFFGCFRDRLKVPRDRQTFERPRFANKRTGRPVPLTRYMGIIICAHSKSVANQFVGTFARGFKSSRFVLRAYRGSLLCLSLGMYNMVSARCQFATSALVADVIQLGDSGRLFGLPTLAGTCSPYSSAASRPASRTSAKASLRQQRQQASQLSLLLRTVDGSVKYRVNCELDELGDNEQYEFFGPHVENERSLMGSNDVAAHFPNADWQFDATDWPHVENCSYESPPYSHEIYAGCSPSIGYPVDLNDIDAAFDCDISTLDAYLHSPPSCSASTELPPHTQPSSTGGPAATQPSAPQPSSTLDTDPIEEFFPDLCDVPAPVPSPPHELSDDVIYLLVASMRSSTSRYSPYSIDSSALAADAAYSEYRTRRDKNNLASQRSRQKRVEKMRQMKDEKETLERRNIELKTLLSSLEVQVADYKRMVLMVVSKSA